LKIEASNEEATYILANLMLMKGQTEGAISTYMALLEKEPNNFNILANLIELMKRAGNISEVQKYLDNAE
jgi:tetratricopeptide (TPR) repeat protein